MAKSKRAGVRPSDILVKRGTILCLIRQIDWCNHWIKLWMNGEAVWEQTKASIVEQTDQSSKRLRRLLATQPEPRPPRRRAKR